MKHITFQGRDYVVARRQHGRPVELVDSQTGKVCWVDPLLVPDSPDQEQYILHDMVPFPLRDPKFIIDLRERRRLLLEQVQKRRAKRDPNTPKVPRKSVPRGSGKVNKVIDEVVPAHLRELVKAAMAAGRKK